MLLLQVKEWLRVTMIQRATWTLSKASTSMITHGMRSPGQNDCCCADMQQSPGLKAQANGKHDEKQMGCEAASAQFLASIGVCFFIRD